MLKLALLASLVLCAVRISALAGLGFGDAEALYVAYAMHPQPAYLDHPGLVGLLAALVGAGSVPGPDRVHVAAAIGATLVPVVGMLAARATGASWERATVTLFALAFVPEVAIGLSALTPHLPLALAWLGALACSAHALRADPKSFRATWTTLMAGGFVGIACLSSASGVLLGLALAAVLLGRGVRARWLTPGPWLALVLAMVLVAPVVAWEVREEFPMLRHRLDATQAGAGLSLRNAGALVGGQLAYVTPPFLFAAWLVLRELFRRRRDDAVGRLLLVVTVVPGVPLIGLCLVSRVAEPHWLAPAFLGLAVGAAAFAGPSRRLGLACCCTGAAVIALGWIVVRTDLQARVLGSRYRARWDLTNDLHAWRTAAPLLEEVIVRERELSGAPPVVVGPHYIVCAQAHVTLGPSIPVGCNTSVGDDFERWFPEERWRAAPTVVFVDDDRFDVVPEAIFPDHAVRERRRVQIYRGGRVVRTLRWVVLDTLGSAMRAVGNSQSPATLAGRRRLRSPERP